MNAVLPTRTVAEPVGINRTKDGLERAALQAAMGVYDGQIAIDDAQGGANIAGAAQSNMSLQEQALHFSAQRILLLFDQMERKLAGGGGGHPLFQIVKLQSRGVTGKRRMGGCHILTVVLP